MMSRWLFTAVLLASSALAGPPLTTIQDVLYKADGTRFAGFLTISWNSFEAIDKSAIATQVATVNVTNGNLWMQLVPTTTAVPAANYTVKYNSDGGIQFSETWAVPSSITPLKVRDVRIRSTQTGAAGADTGVPTIEESDVIGLISDLGARPLKGPGYVAGRVAVVNPGGSLESATGSPSACVRVDGSSGPCGSSQSAYVGGDALSGKVDGSNTKFTLSAIPNPASSVAVYRNGLLKKAGQDYNVNGNAVEFVAAAVPQPGDILLASYRTGPLYLISPQQIDAAGLTAGQTWQWDGSFYVPGNAVDSTGSYSNPGWIASLAYAKITDAPTFEPAIQPASQPGTTGQYWRGDKSWQTLNAAAVANAADTTGSYSNPAWLTITKAKVGLGNVENTGLSTWEGTSNLTTIGTLAAGTVPWARLSGVPSTFAPAGHGGTHAADGSDPVTPAAIGAVASSARNQPNGYVGLDGLGSLVVGTTVLGSGQGKNVLGYGAKCDGTTDDRVAIQAALTAAAGPVIFPDGQTCLITPVADKSKFLSMPPGTYIKGRATLKVQTGSAPYRNVLFAANCTNCLVTDITIDSNVAGNPATNLAELIASPRWEFEILAGSNITVSGVTIKNTNSTNSVNMAGTRITVRDSIFTGLGDDPNHVVHDVSVLYLYGTQIIVTGNHFTGARRSAPAAYTAIETHGSAQTVANNTITDMANGMNITGAWSGTSIASTVTGNVITGAMSGIIINALKLAGIHDTGDGMDGLSIVGNSIRINQLDYSGAVWPNPQTNNGIIFAVGDDMPVRNVVISDNVVVFDLETAPRASGFTNMGIGGYALNPGVSYNDVLIRNNLIVNSPIGGISLVADSITGLDVSGNVVRNAGQSLDAAVGTTYKVPIFIMAAAGILQAKITGNTLIDDFATTRMTVAMYVGAFVTGGDVQITDNNVSLLGATKSAFTQYLTLNDNNVKPLWRQTMNVTNTLAWPTPFRTMAAGSRIFDAATGKESGLWATGTNWTTTQYPRGGSVGNWFTDQVNVGQGRLESASGGGGFSFGISDGTTFTPKVTLDPVNGVISVPQAGTGQSFACWDAAGKLVRSDTACR